MHRKNENYWKGVKFVLFAPVVLILLQAFARPEIIPEKISGLVPSLGVQKDSSEVWLDNWVSSQMKLLNDESYLGTATNKKTPQLINIVDSDARADDANTFTKNNVFIILQNKNSDLLVENKFIKLENLKPQVTSFLKGKNIISGEVPDFKSEELPFVGVVKISEGIILYRKDFETPAKASEAVMKSIAEAILEVRKETAQEKFGEDYFSLPADKKNVVNKLVPVNLSYASPKSTKSSSVGLPPPPPPPVNIKVVKDGKYMLGVYNFQKKQVDWNKTLSEGELKDFLSKRVSSVNELETKYNRTYELVVNVNVEKGTSDSQVNKLKELLRSLGIKNVNYSSDQSKPEEETNFIPNDYRSQYDVIVTAGQLEAFSTVCTVGKLKETLEKHLPLDNDKKIISVLSFNNVPKQRLDDVLNELNNVPFAKVSTTVLKLEQEPALAAQHRILLKASGKISLDDKEYNLTDFESRVMQIANAGNPKVILEIENEVTYIQIETVKRILREANVEQAGYAILRHSVRETNPGTKIGEQSQTFGFAWSGDGLPDLDKVRREADSFLSKKGNYSLYASIKPDKNATQDQIDTVKDVLLKAGFLKVEVRK